MGTGILLRLLACLPEDAHPCLLLSADDSGPSWLGVYPYKVLACRQGRCTVARGGGPPVEVPGGPLEALAAELDVAPGGGGGAAAEGWPASGGAVGYLGYEAGLDLVDVPDLLAADLPLPDAWFAFFQDLVEVVPGGTPRVPQVLAERCPVLARAAAGDPLPEEGPVPGAPPAVALRSPFTRAAYQQAVSRVLDHIFAGDVFQADLTQPFSGPLPFPPRALFARMAFLTPAPFAAYLELEGGLGGAAVLSASPEEFLRVRDGKARTRPIKGTRPRSPDPAEDRRLAAELLESPKDRAELAMIVDLLRNDLGKVARFGTVEVASFPELVTLPQVHHLRAEVRCVLRPGTGAVDLLRAAFPGGSVTGAPKRRAMQLLQEVERVRRGVYTGAIGWLGPDGSAHLNVAIRTLAAARGRCRFSVGGGIVAASDPAAEYLETLAKARGLASALGARLLAADGEAVG